jgi:hypothetical protein
MMPACRLPDKDGKFISIHIVGDKKNIPNMLKL